MFEFCWGFTIGSLVGWLVNENDRLARRVRELEDHNLEYARRADNL